MLKKKKIYLAYAYVFKNNSNREKQVIVLMISNEEKQWHYLAVKNYCVNCLHSFRPKIKLESHKRLYVNKDFCNVVMSSEGTKILEFNQYKKSDKVPFIIYADIESIIQKIDGCKNNLKNSSKIKVSEHIPSGFFSVYNILI